MSRTAMGRNIHRLSWLKQLVKQYAKNSDSRKDGILKKTL